MPDDSESKHACIYDNGEPIDYADGNDEYDGDEDDDYERVWVVFCHWDTAPFHRKPVEHPGSVLQ